MEANGQTVLVTGGTGFVGKILTKKLYKENYKVVVFSKSDNQRTTKNHETFYQVDYLNYEKLQMLFKAVRPRHIIHLAATRNRTGFNGYGVEELKKFINSDINIILAASTLKNLKTFVYFGSADCYASSIIPLSYKTSFAPDSPYGFVKANGMNLVESLNRSNNFPGINLIPSLIYGPGQKPDMFIPSLILHILSKKEFKMTAGLQKRDYIFVSDVVDVVMKLIKTDSNFHFGKRFLLGSGENKSIRDLAFQVAEMFPKGAKNLIKVGALKQIENHDRSYKFDMSKTFEQLSWQPKYNLEIGLTEVIRFFEGNLSEKLDYL